MLLRTCPVLGTINTFKIGLRMPVPSTTPREQIQRSNSSSVFLSSASYPLSFNIPVRLLPSEQSKFIISNQLSPSPSGRAALGHGGWGPRDCGVTVVCARVYANGCISMCESMYRSQNLGVGVVNVWGYVSVSGMCRVRRELCTREVRVLVSEVRSN